MWVFLIWNEKGVEGEPGSPLNSARRVPSRMCILSARDAPCRQPLSSQPLSE